MEEPPAHICSHPHAGVVVCNINPGQVDGRFFDTWDDVMDYDRDHHHHRRGKVYLESGPRVAEARTQTVYAFLGDARFATADWLLLLDADMVMPEDLLCRMLQTAYDHDDNGRHVRLLGGLCFAGGKSKMYPTIYAAVMGEYGLEPRPIDDIPEPRGIVKSYATGGACLLIHRSVLVEMIESPFGLIPNDPDKRRSPFPWFVEGLNSVNGQPVGEDVAFCIRALALGIGCYVDTTLEIGHRKTYTLDFAEWQRYRRLRDLDEDPMSAYQVTTNRQIPDLREPSPAMLAFRQLIGDRA